MANQRRKGSATPKPTAEHTAEDAKSGGTSKPKAVEAAEAVETVGKGGLTVIAKKVLEVGSAPTTRDELHEWVRTRLELDLSRRALTAPGPMSHSAPFDYVAWAFLESVAPKGKPAPGIPDAVVWANRGGGKTLLGAVATALDLIFRPGIEVRILAGSMEQAQRMHAHLRRLLGSDTFAGLIEGRMTDRRIRLTNKSGVELLAQSQTAVRGTRVQRVRCDEVELFDPDVWDAAQLVTRSMVCGDVLVPGSIECLSTMHLPHGLMHRLVAETREGRRRLFQWGVMDVLGSCGPEHVCGGDQPGTPASKVCGLWAECGGRAKARPGNLRGRGVGHMEVRDVLRMKGRVSLPMWESEMLCVRPRRDDTVLPEFSPAVHVVDTVPALEAGGSVRWVGGMDFGYRAPTVVLWAVVDERGALWVVDELSRSGRTVAENAEAILAPERPGLAWLGVDPAGNSRNEQTGRSSVQVLRDAGLEVKVTWVPVVRGLEMLRARLRPADASGRPGLFVHRRCATLIESLERYHYPKDPEALEPAKDGFDHAVDALRYMVQNLDRPGSAKLSRYI